ncbi:hypothetical protein [Herbaspirillum sp. RV1423]|nr:hypothetical protein [Herbaspirillum sp. RV1423]
MPLASQSVKLAASSANMRRSGFNPGSKAAPLLFQAHLQRFSTVSR